MELNFNQFQKIINSPHHIRNVVVSSDCFDLQKQIWPQLKSKMIRNISQRDTYPYYDRHQDYMSQRQCLSKSNIFSVCHKIQPQKNKQEIKQVGQYLINFMRSSQIIPGIDYQMQQNFRICDGTVMVVKVGHINEDALCRILNLMVRNCLVPIIFLDLGQIKSELKKINFKKVSWLINQTIQNIRQIFKLVSERSSISFKESDILKIENFMFGLIDEKWGLSLNQLIQLLQSPQQNSDKEIRLKFLDNIYWGKRKQWKKQSTNLQQHYQQIQIVQVLCQLHEISQKKLAIGELQQFQMRFLQQLGFRFKQQNKSIQPSEKYRNIMKSNFPISHNILDSIVRIVPSPIQNQKFKLKPFYLGHEKDQIAQLIIKSDPKAPFMAYISKKEEFFAGSFANRVLMFGRILSGTYIGNKNYKIIQLPIDQYRKDNPAKNIRCICLIGRQAVPTNNLCAGNILFSNQMPVSNRKHFLLIDPQLNLSSQHFNFIQTKLQNTVKKIIAPADAKELPKLFQQFRKINTKTNYVRIQTQDTGELCMRSSFPSFLEVYCRQINQKVQITESQTETLYKQTIASFSSKIALAKSPNKHNRLYGVAFPMQKNDFQLLQQLHYACPEREINNKFLQQSKWDIQKQGQIWSFGQQDLKENILINSFSPNQPLKTYMSEIKQSMISAFFWAAKSGVLAEENVSKVCYRLVDCELVSDTIHRGGGQIIPTARRLFYASSLLADPILLQPFHKYTVVIKQNNLQPLFNLCQINQITYQEQKPVQQKLMLVQSLKLIDVQIPPTKNSSWLYNLCYSIKKVDTIWKPTEGLALKPGSKTSEIVRQIRRRKGLNINIPELDIYMDKF